MLNRRQFIGTMGATALGLGLVGCGGSGSADSGSGTTDGSDGAKKKKVAIFLDGPINDGGWGA